MDRLDRETLRAAEQARTLASLKAYYEARHPAGMRTHIANAPTLANLWGLLRGYGYSRDELTTRFVRAGVDLTFCLSQP